MQRKYLEHAENILVIILNHILLVAVTVTLMDLFRAKSSYLWLLLATVLIPCALYFAKMMKKPRAIPAPLTVVLLGICSMAEKIQDKHHWEGYYLFFICSYLIGYYFLYFIRQFLETMRLNEKSAANVPEEIIFKSGLKQMFVYCTGSMLVFLFAANLDWFGKFMQSIGNIGLMLLRWIFSKIDFVTEEEIPNQVEEEVTPRPDGSTGEAVSPEFDPENMRRALILFFVVTAIIAFIVIVYLIYKYGRLYWERRNDTETEGVLRTNGDIREKCEFVKNKKKREKWFVFFDNREKIRKRYRKRVLAGKRELIGEAETAQLAYLTAKECCERLSEEKLRAVYEKARYSEAEIIAEDVKGVL